MSCSPVRTNPGLWERVKESVKRSSKGGVAGKWSARKAQLSVALYKKKGGGYRGGKKSCNSLTRWTKQDWGYISPGKKSGRYLPRKVRKSLTSREKRVENTKKGSRRGVRVPYSKSVARKVRKVTSKY